MFHHFIRVALSDKETWGFGFPNSAVLSLQFYSNPSTRLKSTVRGCVLQVGVFGQLLTTEAKAWGYRGGGSGGSERSMKCDLQVSKMVTLTMMGNQRPAAKMWPIYFENLALILISGLECCCCFWNPARYSHFSYSQVAHHFSWLFSLLFSELIEWGF